MAWTYEQLFNELNTADLNGQDSWSGDAKFDVVTTSPWEGAKCVASVHEADSSVAISRSITGISAGVFYVSIKVNRTAGTRRGSIQIYSGATMVGRIFCSYSGSGKIQMLTNDGASWIDLDSGISNNTWYRIGIEYDNATQANKYRTNINGGSWTSWYGFFGSPSWTNIDKLEFVDDGNNASGTGTMYWDAVSPDYYPELTTGLVSYWKLDESSGDAADSVGPNTLTNVNTAAFAGGLINNGADLERGSSQKFTIADGSQTGLDITGALTISAWVKLESQPTSTVDGRAIVSKFGADTGFDQGYSLEYYYNVNKKLRFLIVNTDNYYIADLDPADLPNTEWHHIVGVFTPSTKVELFLDGVSVASYTTSIPAAIGDASSTNFSIGRRFANTAYDFDGMIDEVGIWSRPLSSAEITELYNDGDGIQWPFVTVTSGIKTVIGLARASVKTVNGLALASVKTVNGLE